MNAFVQGNPTISRDHLIPTNAPLQPFQVEESPVSSPLKSHVSTWLLAIATCASVIFTVYFAYNSTLEKPLSQALIFSRPQRTILTLSILSQLTIFLMGHLTNSLFEMVRWAFASRGRNFGVELLYSRKIHHPSGSDNDNLESTFLLSTLVSGWS